MKFLTEEKLNGKTYLFRGESNDKYQSNYSHKFKTTLNSRYYAFEPFDGIYQFGYVVIYELLNSSNILDYDDSVEEFVDEYDLHDYKSVWLQKIYNVSTLEECKDFDYHDWYHAYQIVATEYLESQTNYDGIIWYESNDTPESQIQIWNKSIVKRLSPKKAKEVLAKLAELYPDYYKVSDYAGDFWERKYNLKE